MDRLNEGKKIAFIKSHNIVLSLIILCIIILSVLLNLTTSNSYTYEAEGLFSKTEHVLEGDDASGGLYRFAASNESGFVVFGPYVKIPEGDYVALFRLKTDANSGSKSVALVDIFSLSSGKINGIEIYGRDFKELNSYQSFEVPFKSDEQENLEFRVYKHPGENLWVDSITISPVDKFSVYKSVIIQVAKIIIFLLGGLILITTIRRLKIVKSVDLSKQFNFSIKVEMLLFIFVILIYIIIAIGAVGQVHTPTGDEPHYLITTHSIVNDGDIYLENNYLNKDYTAFYPSLSIYPHISQTLDGRWLSSHGIGLSGLLAIPYFILGLLGVRFFLALMAIFLIINIFFLIKENLGDKKVALLASLGVAFTSPILFYSHSVYSETIAALILVYSTRVLYKIYNQESVPGSKHVLCGILIAFLPWLGIKYVSLMFPLTILFLFYNKNNKVDLLKILSPIALSSFLYAVFMFKMFGSLSPVRTYGETKLSTFFSVLNLFSPSKIVSYFFDQQVGLIFYAPIYIFSLIGLIIFIKGIKTKKHFDGFLILLLPSIFYFFMYASSIAWGGWSPPSRPLVAIIPPIAFLLSVGLSFFINKKLNLNIYILYVLSFGIAIVLLKNPSFLFHNWSDPSADSSAYFYGKSNLLVYIGGSPFVDFTKIFPSFITKINLDNWIYLFLWLGLFVILATIEYIYRHPTKI